MPSRGEHQFCPHVRAPNEGCVYYHEAPKSGLRVPHPLPHSTLLNRTICLMACHATLRTISRLQTDVLKPYSLANRLHHTQLTIHPTVHLRAIFKSSTVTSRPQIDSSPSINSLAATQSISSRTLTTTLPRRRTSSTRGTTTDEDRPDLFYHLFDPPTPLSPEVPIFAISFLELPPPSILSASVIGWLPALGPGEGAGLNDFVENGTSDPSHHIVVCGKE